ncbi:MULTISPECIES: phage tail protein [unclassified Halomonas]|uniref:phage tail-collar fiber domain-containing protein n=1 Tax=unclassified Halomonas TaxID=2609666 RepID=UPI00288696ED|nr:MULTISPECIES: phage tail protein [unclassified Halomonas]MDT0499717.1 phage tail protein [Halomonas sp. PAR7]MDT0589825.1 phage tail protein [Halomonas sp. PAR8]
MSFATIHTNAGLIAMAEAEAAGAAINLTEMAVGDGNGNPVEPDPTQAQLARERYRAAVNRVWQDPENPQRFTAELIVPAEEGGWTMREVGVFDQDGTLFAVGNLPEAYKPAEGEGAFSDAVVRLEFMVDNADVITLQIDPNVAIATQAWIINNITPASLLPGGTTGQRLAKASNADGDVEWVDLDVQNVTVDIIDERQTLADGQTQVDLTTCTTYGLAIYIDGLRLLQGSGADEWQPDITLETRLALGKSYPAGTEIYCVQNEPSGSAPAPLEKSQNLADVPDKALARANLDIYSRAQVRQMAPAGMVAHFARSTAPTGWLKANGAAVSRSVYSELFAAIGTSYGEGDGFTTFNLPDLRGEFLRGWDDGRGIDGGRALGSSQTDDNKSHDHSASSSRDGSHSHSGSANGAGAHSHSASSSWQGDHRHQMQDAHPQEAEGEDGQGVDSGPVNRTTGAYTKPAGGHRHSISIGNAGHHSHSLSINSAGAHSHAITVDEAGGAESRPRNVALLACIKF